MACRCVSTTSPRSNAGSARARCPVTTASISVSLNADVAPGHALDEASNDVRGVLASLKMPPEITYRLSGQSKILDETTANLILAIALAMIFVYMVLAAQFESFVQPIVIMLVLPLAVPFALLTLYLTGRTLNLWSALGMLLLLGIVKKNSILQVDYANVLRARRRADARGDHRGVPDPAAADSDDDLGNRGGADPDRRWRWGSAGRGRAGIAVTVIGGQSLCLFLTLLLVPVAYLKFDALEQSSLNQRFKQWFSRATASTLGRLRPRQVDHVQP